MKKVTVGRKLQALRKSNKLSIEDVCDKVFISKSSLQKYETDRRVPRDNVKKRLAEFYGTTVSNIFFDE